MSHKQHPKEARQSRIPGGKAQKRLGEGAHSLMGGPTKQSAPQDVERASTA